MLRLNCASSQPLVRAVFVVILAVVAAPELSAEEFYCVNPSFRFGLTNPPATYQTGYTIQSGKTCNKRPKSEISERFTKLILQESPSHGVVKLHPDGGFDYTAKAGYRGRDSYTVRICIGDVSKPGGSACADLKYDVTIE